MALFAKSSSGTATSVLDVGSSHVAAARFEGQHSALRLVDFAFREISDPDETLSDRVSSELTQAITEVAPVLGKKTALTLVIPGHLALIKTIRVTTAAAAQREKLIAFEARQNIPFPLEEVVWSYQIRQEIEGEWEVLLVAAKIDAVREFLAAVSAAGLTVDRVVPASIASVDTPTLTKDAELLVSIGSRSTHLLFRAGNSCQLRTLSLAGQSITRSIATTLNQSRGEAEQLKRGVLSGTVDLPEETPAGQAVKTAADSFMARLQLEISRSLVTQVRQTGAATPSQLRLTGGGSLVPGIAEFLGKKWRGSVNRFDAFDKVEVAPELRSTVETAGPDRLADLVGAALVPGGANPVINLAPPELGEAREARRRRPRWWVAAALFVVVLALPGLHHLRLSQAREAVARDLSQQMVPLQQLADQNRRNADELERLRLEREVLVDRVAARDAWAGLLIDLQASLSGVGDVWLERLEVLPLDLNPPSIASGVQDDFETENELERPTIRLRLSGRLLDRENPLSRVSPAAYERATDLLNRFVESPRILEVAGERFDASEPGLLRFDFTLVINRTAAL